MRSGTYERTPEVRAKQSGVNHPRWQGEETSYKNLHLWLAKMKEKTGICSSCSQERYTQWANISGEYRRDPDDFIELCVPCHKRYDKEK